MTNEQQAAALAKMVEGRDPKAIWSRVQKTDPAYTKGFTRGGGFRGTAINATYQIGRATEIFGPCGIGWGIKVLESQVLAGAPIMSDQGLVIGQESVFVLMIELWYVHPETKERGFVVQSGATMLVSKTKHGPFTDEEAVKKAITDATTKCLSWLGFSADVHLGLYDDNKYVHGLEAEKAAEAKRPKPREAPKPAEPVQPVARVDALDESLAAPTGADGQPDFAAWAAREEKLIFNTIKNVDTYRQYAAAVTPLLKVARLADPAAANKVLAALTAKAGALGISSRRAA